MDNNVYVLEGNFYKYILMYVFLYTPPSENDLKFLNKILYNSRGFRKFKISVLNVVKTVKI